jgi:hypothetical protein
VNRPVPVPIAQPIPVPVPQPYAVSLPHPVPVFRPVTLVPQPVAVSASARIGSTIGGELHDGYSVFGGLHRGPVGGLHSGSLSWSYGSRHDHIIKE